MVEASKNIFFVVSTMVFGGGKIFSGFETIFSKAEKIFSKAKTIFSETKNIFSETKTIVSVTKRQAVPEAPERRRGDSRHGLLICIPKKPESLSVHLLK